LSVLLFWIGECLRWYLCHLFYLLLIYVTAILFCCDLQPSKTVRYLFISHKVYCYFVDATLALRNPATWWPYIRVLVNLFYAKNDRMYFYALLCTQFYLLWIGISHICLELLSTYRASIFYTMFEHVWCNTRSIVQMVEHTNYWAV